MSYLKDKKAPIVILLVEDNLGDVILAKKALSKMSMPVNIIEAHDGEEAISLLTGDRAKPDLIFLDLNLPKKDGISVLQEIKNNDILKTIPVIIMSSSKAESDISGAYKNHANCYIIKPDGMQGFIESAKIIEKFWISLAAYP